MKTLKTLTVGEVISIYENSDKWHSMDQLIRELQLRMKDDNDLFIKAIYKIRNPWCRIPIMMIIQEMTTDIKYDKENDCYRISTWLYRWIRANQDPVFHYLNGLVLFNKFLFGCRKYTIEYASGCFRPYLCEVYRNWKWVIKYSKAFEKHFQS